MRCEPLSHVPHARKRFDWRKDGWWVLVSVALIIVLAFFLRWSSSVMEKETVWDEKYILVPIIDLIERGWSVETAIDFQEAKGPAMIWPYALWGELFGHGVTTLRLLSILCFILTLVPLLWIAWRCGLSPPAFPLVAIALFLLPFEAVVAQLVMGESSYILGVSLMLAIVLWACHHPEDAVCRLWGPVLYAIVLVVLLHSRIHVVPIAGGVCLAMFCRDRFGSWPWWLASVVAGLLRIPLWIRWGGLVSSDYQGMHGIGLRFESLTYFAAAFATPFAIFMLVWFFRYRYLVYWWWVPMGFLLGLFLGFAAPPDLVDPQRWEEIDVQSISLFMGPTRSLIISVVPESSHWILVSIFSAIGLGGLAAFGSMAFQCRFDQSIASLSRIQFLSLLCAWTLYIFTYGFVFDRFILAWTAAMPVLWLAMLPRWAWILQGLLLVVHLVLLASSWIW